MPASKNWPVRRQPAHARIPAAWDRLPAWRTLDSRGRDLIGFMMRAYRPPSSGMPNAFVLTDADAAALLGCSENTARSVVQACVDRGWFVLERRGGCHGPRSARSRVISLSMFPTDNRGSEQRRFQEWRPEIDASLPRAWFTPRPWVGERYNP